MKVLFLILFCFSLVQAGVCSAGSWRVEQDGSGDFTTIQPALDAAADGDTVFIGPGEFLEETVYRPTGWGYDVRAYGRVANDNLTIIGSGVGVTTIGPETYVNDESQGNPKGFAYDGQNNISIESLTIRNCNGGIWMWGTLFLDKVESVGCKLGVQWETVGAGGWVKNSNFKGTTEAFGPVFSLHITGVGSDITVKNCNFVDSEVTVRGIENCQFLRCNWSDDWQGISIYGSASVSADSCSMTGMENAGVVFLSNNGSCEIRNSTVGGGRRALETTFGCEFVVSNSTLIGGTTAVVYARQNPSPLKINNCDLIKGSGPVVLCEGTNVPVTHDLTNNYWGTSDPAEIEQWIIDINDDPSVLATVLFEPFSHESVPVDSRSRSMGSLKAMFR